MPTFNERHKPIGCITNQPHDYDPERPYASTVVCGRDECQEKAKFWVQGVTGETAVFVAFHGRR